MKKLIPFILIFVFSITWAQQQNVVYNVSPNPIDENQSVTLSFEGSSINESTWNVTDNALYLWSWSYDINDTNEQDCPTNGSWTNSSETNRLTYIPGTDTYEISFIPSIFYDRSEIGRIGFLIKAKNGNGDKKSQDILVEVGSFEVDLITPSENSTTSPALVTGCRINSEYISPSLIPSGILKFDLCDPGTTQNPPSPAL